MMRHLQLSSTILNVSFCLRTYIIYYYILTPAACSFDLIKIEDLLWTCLASACKNYRSCSTASNPAIQACDDFLRLFLLWSFVVDIGIYVECTTWHSVLQSAKRIWLHWFDVLATTLTSSLPSHTAVEVQHWSSRKPPGDISSEDNVTYANVS